LKPPFEDRKPGYAGLFLFACLKFPAGISVFVLFSHYLIILVFMVEYLSQLFFSCDLSAFDWLTNKFIPLIYIL